eukprot:gnl/MRDRNA2_/MRDRNA2_103814_c0_seq1.p1 gnl/MRDRNA2_/MRDRNA2_103814_c0~~gnl/MRDRNA2_/MRDRNA2_103814_c0_seq1.p1  ORF type:complete len:338 (-),score=44.46 gnl/MRDRNA2_/MRDRNA2_103814_c0_seq1:74-1087(-)
MISNMLKAVGKLVSTKTGKGKRHNRKTKTFIQHTSQCQFKHRDQTAIILDWDDTLFPTSFLERSGFRNDLPMDQQPNMSQEVLIDFLKDIDECQAAAESLLRCAQNFGRIIIVTLANRVGLRRHARLYPRIFDLLKVSQISIVHARDYEAENSTQTGMMLKAMAISRELERFYSQYKRQSWKNVISIGDSNSERYGTLGATNAYVQKQFSNAKISKEEAYRRSWQDFDRDPDWSQNFEGVYDGHMFKIRTKVIKLLDAPSSTDLAQELTLLLQWFPSIICYDECMDLVFNNLKEETVESFESALAASARGSSRRPHNPLLMLSVPDPQQVPSTVLSS